VNNGTLNLGGNYTTADLAGLVRTGGTVNISGTLTNTGATLALTAATGSFRLNGGVISGGSITTAAGSGAVLQAGGSFSNFLSGVAVGRDATSNASALDLSANNSYAKIYNTTFAAGSVLTLGGGSVLSMTPATTLDGVTVALAANSQLAFNNADNNTIGPAVTVTQATNTTGRITASGSGGITVFYLTNQGLIQANAPGATTNVVTNAFTNTGTLLAGNGGTINLPIPIFSNMYGTTLTGGTYVVQGSSTMNFGSYYPTIATIAAGTTVTLDGAGSVFAAANTVTANAGYFNLLNGRAFTVTGGTLTNTGSLQVGSGANLTGNINTTGGTVSGSGTITGNATVNPGATIRGGAAGSTGTLTLGGNLTLATSSTLAAKLQVTADTTTASNLQVGGTVNFSRPAGTGPVVIELQSQGLRLGTAYTRTIATATGGFLRNGAGPLPSGTVFDLGNDYVLTSPDFASFSSVTLQIQAGNNLVFQFVPVPEPAAFMFAAAGLVAARGWRRVARR
jgi:hypothetical protein